MKVEPEFMRAALVTARFSCRFIHAAFKSQKKELSALAATVPFALFNLIYHLIPVTAGRESADIIERILLFAVITYLKVKMRTG